jgi:hypothetical protein
MRLCLGVLLGLAAGGAVCAALLYFEPISTQPVELMGSLVYMDDINIANRLFAVRMFLAVSILTFIAVVLSPVSLRVSQCCANCVTPKAAALARRIGGMSETLLAKLLNSGQRANFKWFCLAVLFGLAAPAAGWILIQTLLELLTKPSVALPLLKPARTVLWFATAILLCAALYVWLRKPAVALHRLAWGAQFALLPFYLLLLPIRVNTGDAFVAAFREKRMLILLALIIAAGVWDIVRRRKRPLGEGCISPIAAFALLMGVCTGSYPSSLLVNPFELGSRITGFWMSANGWSALFKDSYVIYGLYDIAGMGMGWLLFGKQTAMAASHGFMIFPVVCKAALFAAARRYMPLYAAFLLTYFAVDGRTCLVLVYVGLLIAPVLFRRPARWLVVWGVVSAFMPFAINPQGAIAVAATFPAAALQLYTIYRSDKKRFIQVLVFGCALLFVIAVWPFGEYLHAYLRASFEAAAVNAPWAANLGITWRTVFENPPGYFLYFIPPLLALCIAYYIYSQDSGRKDTNITIWFLIGFVLIYEFLAVSYGFSRLDNRVLVRNYFVFCIANGVLIFFVYRFFGSRLVKTGFFLLLSVVFCLGLFTRADFSLKRVYLPSFFTNGRLLQGARSLTNGKEFGIPNLGKGIYSSNIASKEQVLRKALDRVLTERETFFDLTRGSLHHFLTERKFWLEFANYYVYPGDKPQLRAIEKLAERQINVSLLDLSDWVSDKSPANLRAYYLYRHALLNGRPWRISPQMALLMPDEYFRRAGLDLPGHAESMLLLDGQFPVLNLNYLPAVWGRGYRKFKDSLGLAVDFGLPPSAGKSAVWIGEFGSPAALRGRDAGLLYIDIELPPEAGEIPLTVRWNDAGLPDSNSKMNFTARNGVHLVPLDSAPRWLLAEDIRSVMVDARCESCSFEIKAIKLLTRPHLARAHAANPGKGFLEAAAGTDPAVDSSAKFHKYLDLPRIKSEGAIDSLALTQSGDDCIALGISGWAADTPRRVLASEIFLDVGGRYFPLEYGKVPRPDVAKKFKEPKFNLSGFRQTVYLNDLPDGEHRIAVWAVAQNKNGIFELRHHKINFLRKKGSVVELH